MSNNIYDILKKIESLEAPKKTTLTESKMTTVKELHNESKKEKSTRKGSIAEAVARVEQQLNEKYMGFKKLEKSIAARGDVKDPAAVAASIGRKKYGKAKFQKAAAAGKKLGEAGLDPNLKTPNIDRQVAYQQKGYERDSGAMAAADADARGQAKYKSRTEPGIINKVKDTFGLDKPDPTYGPKTNEGAVEESGLQAYLGKKKYGETGMRALQKAGREGASKEKMAMIRAKHDKMDEAVDQEGPADLLAAVEQEINNPGRSIDNLTDVLNATFGSDRSPEFKKARAFIGKYIDLVDNAAMGSEQDGIAPMQGGNIARHIQQYDLTDYLQHAAAMLDKAVKGPMSEGNYNEEMLSPKQKSFAALAEPKDKITYADKIAGAKKGKKDEGNAYGLAVQNTPPGEEIKINGKGTGDIKKESKTSMREGNKTADTLDLLPNPIARGASAVIRKGTTDELGVDKDRYKKAADMLDLLPNPIARGASAVIRKGTTDEGKKSMREGWEEMQKYLEKKRGPESKGGAGKKAGTRYGGSAQRDDDEETDGEGQAVVKKKGRPKGTGGGAKFSFKKPKD